MASVKESPEPRPNGVRLGMSMSPFGRFQATYATVRQLTLAAYNLKAYQLVGGPDWINQVHFDILADAPDQFEMGHTRAMRRRLLESRFGLVVEEGRTDLDVFTLEVADGRALAKGFRTPSPACDDLAPMMGASQPRARSGILECTGGWGTDLSGWVYVRHGPVENLIAMLQPQVDKPVLDRTGMAGRYNLDLRFTVDDVIRGPANDRRPTDPDRPSLSTALREQLGLKLVSRREEMPIVRIIAVHRPGPN